MTAILKAIPAKKPEIDDSLVTYLEEALERAKSGEMKTLLTLEEKEETYVSRRFGVENRLDAAGRIYAIIHEMMST